MRDHASNPLVVDEFAAARAIGMSVAWLRKDRRNKRLIPFCKIGSAVRYNLESMSAALAAVEVGGPACRARSVPRS